MTFVNVSVAEHISKKHRAHGKRVHGDRLPIACQSHADRLPTSHGNEVPKLLANRMPTTWHTRAAGPLGGSNATATPQLVRHPLRRSGGNATPVHHSFRWQRHRGPAALATLARAATPQRPHSPCMNTSSCNERETNRAHRGCPDAMIWSTRQNTETRLCTQGRHAGERTEGKMRVLAERGSRRLAAAATT
jgi:hypothetical protein